MSVTLPEQNTVPARPDATRMHPVSLCFRDPALEERFVLASLRSVLPVLRLFLLGGAILGALFGVLDPVAAPDDYHGFWAIRFGCIVPALLGAWGLTYTPIFIGRAQFIMTAALLCTGGGVLAMIAITQGPAKETYYAGLILVAIYGSSLVRLNHLNALRVAALLIAGYQLVALVVNPLPPRILFSNDFAFVVAVLVSALSSFFQEFYIRRNFINRELLIEGKARAERL